MEMKYNFAVNPSYGWNRYLPIDVASDILSILNVFLWG